MHVNVYGARMPLNQVATVTVPEPRMVSVQVWDRTNVHAGDKAIREANLGINPIIDGTTIRLPIPALTAERRTEPSSSRTSTPSSTASPCATCAARAWASQEARERRQDEPGRAPQELAKVQELTDKLVKEIDATLAHKESEIQKV